MPWMPIEQRLNTCGFSQLQQTLRTRANNPSPLGLTIDPKEFFKPPSDDAHVIHSSVAPLPMPHPNPSKTPLSFPDKEKPNHHSSLLREYILTFPTCSSVNATSFTRRPARWMSHDGQMDVYHTTTVGLPLCCELV